MMSVSIAKKDSIGVGQVKKGREVRFVTRGTGGGRGDIKIKDINRGIVPNYHLADTTVVITRELRRGQADPSAR
jgi:hypothetical protein